MNSFDRFLAAVSFIAFALAVPTLALAQGTPVHQQGSVSPEGLGHPAKITGNGAVMDPGGLTGDLATGRGLAPFSVTDGTDADGVHTPGLGTCWNSQPTSTNYNALCLGHNTSGAPQITVDSYGLAGTSLLLRQNGQSYSFPSTGGNIVGPSPTVVGNAAAWNNTGGTLMRDAGAPPALHVATKAALAATIGTSGMRIYRDGFTVSGDGGGNVPYNWSAVNCPTPDNGAQVQPGATGCWIADFSNLSPTPLIWGAAGDGTTNDSAAMQAAINALQNSTLFLGPKLYALNSGVTSAGDIKIVGDANCAHGLKAGATNLNLITLIGYSPVIKDLCISMAATSNVNTAGYAIVLQPVNGADAHFGSTIDNVQINNPCGGIDLQQGNQPVINNVRMVSVAHAGCNGMRIGSATTGGGTLDVRITNTLIGCDQANPADNALLIKDGGGLHVGPGNDFIFCGNGVKIFPGANQSVLWGFFTGVLGDSSVTHGLMIDTGAVSGHVEGNTFSQSWTANSVASSEVLIQNTAGGIVNATHFVGHRAYMNANNNGFDIEAGTNTSITASTVCSYSAAASAGTGIILAGANTIDTTIIGNRIGGCNNAAGVGGQSLAGAISVVQTNPLVGTITQNDLRNSVVPLTWLPAAALPVAVIKDNLGIDENALTVASAATITLGIYPTVFITGTATITTINTLWPRSVLITTVGAVPFATGGNICNALTSTPIVPILATFVEAGSNCWYLK